MINYFLLAYQGFDHFREKFDKKKYPNTKLRIIDNGNQKIEGYELYKTKIPRNIRVAEAPSFGKSILEYDGLSKGSLSYYSLSGEIIKDE